MELKWALKIVMRVIAEDLDMESRSDKITFKRRSFMARFMGALAGGWTAGNLLSGIARSTTRATSNRSVQIKINPLAVPRTNKDSTSHGA
jgi:hypothetical protein